MATWNYAPDSDDEEIEDVSEYKILGKSALLLLVDCTPEMFKPWKEGDVPFRAAIKCCQSILRSKVTTNDRNSVISIIFVGTKESKNPSGLVNIYQLNELSPVKVEVIEKLNAMKDSEDFDGFEENIGSSENYNLKDVFWLAKMIIDEGNATTFQKRIIYFTANDAPHDGKSTLQSDVIKKFRDIGKVSFTVVAFNDLFKREKFYSRIDEDESGIIMADNLENLLKAVRVKARGRRPITKTTFEIVPDVKIAVGFYTFARPVNPPKAVSVDKRTNEEVVKTTNEFRSDSGMPVLKSEARKMISVQGEKAVFTADEVKQIKQGNESGLSLIGFLNLESFDPFAWYRSPGYFLYPEDDKITGSKTLFTALLKRCVALGKIALVKMVLTRGKSAKLACLIPSLQEPMFPQGFHVFPVPFCDEIRQYECEFPNEPSDTLVALMEKVIKKITNKNFDVLDVHNPMVQYRWRELERTALDISEDDQEDFDDLTVPNEDLMVQRLGELPELIEKETGGFSRQKSTASVIPTSANFDMAMEARHKRVEKLTVPILKDFLQSKRIDTGRMRKAELVQAVYKCFEN